MARSERDAALVDAVVWHWAFARFAGSILSFRLFGHGESAWRGLFCCIKFRSSFDSPYNPGWFDHEFLCRRWTYVRRLTRFPDGVPVFFLSLGDGQSLRPLSATC